jgi:hypothetical protein
MAPLTTPTQLTITKADSTTEVVAIINTYSKDVTNIYKAGGYWGGTNGTVWTPYGQIKSIVAS